MPEYNWPSADKRSLIGTRISRLDGLSKSSGAAKYSYDINRPKMLWAKVLTCPYGNAKVVSVNTAAAEKTPGVKAVDIISKPGTPMRWHGDVVAAVAADTEEHAMDGIRAIQVEYEVLEHFVEDSKIEKAGERISDAGEQIEGEDVEKALGADDVVTIEGDYGIEMINHCCMEPHGLVVEWTGDDELTIWLSTQNVSRGGESIGKNLDVPAGNVHVICQNMGGGFGSKFSADRWDGAAARLAKKTGRPVKLLLDRDIELQSAGSRPSAFSKIKVGVKKDGTLAAWKSLHWGTGGANGGGVNVSVMPYLFSALAERESVAKSLTTNIGVARAWRAPNHPQGAALTMTALADAAAAIGMDELEFFLKNAGLTRLRGGAEGSNIYTQELLVAADLIDWKKKWHSRGDKTAGPIKRGIGLSMHTWGGTPGRGKSDVSIHPDGSVTVQSGSQDVGTGTRTIFAIVAAETLGLNVEDVTVRIGDSHFVASNASGGSITVGGISSSTRRATVDALDILFSKVAPALDTTPDKLEAVGGKIQVKGDASKSLSWKQACRRLGMESATSTGSQPDNTRGQLASGGVGGVQAAEVSVDIETGIIKIENFVAVQDCGLIIDMKTAESQVHGAVIQGISWALMEEAIHDPTTGRRLNGDMEFYKLPGVGDIGEIKVHMMRGKQNIKAPNGENIVVDYDSKGVVGLGEPPAISPGAAISNAVANAIGVRVPYLPLTPERVIDALQKGGVA